MELSWWFKLKSMTEVWLSYVTPAPERLIQAGIMYEEGLLGQVEQFQILVWGCFVSPEKYNK